MYQPASGAEYMLIPVSGPQADLTAFTVSVALVADGPDTIEPATGDYKTGSWIGGEAALLLTTGLYPPGEYMAWVRVLAPPEDVRRPAGRVRIGDTRT